jgi:hypothetical protein
LLCSVNQDWPFLTFLNFSFFIKKDILAIFLGKEMNVFMMNSHRSFGHFRANITKDSDRNSRSSTFSVMMERSPESPQITSHPQQFLFSVKEMQYLGANTEPDPLRSLLQTFAIHHSFNEESRQVIKYFPPSRMTSQSKN